MLAYTIKEGKGRPPLLQPEQPAQIRQWAKAWPKNLNKMRALIQETFGLDASKQTSKRILKSLQCRWRRVRQRVKGQPDPALYQERKAALETLRAEDQEGIIDLRYFDESGFCLVPYVPYACEEQGETLAIPSQPSRRLHVLGLMNTRNALAAYGIEGPVTSAVVVRGIDAFCHTIEMPTVIVMDNASIHTSQAIQERLSIWEKQGVWLFSLPAYSGYLRNACKFSLLAVCPAK